MCKKNCEASCLQYPDQDKAALCTLTCASRCNQVCTFMCDFYDFGSQCMDDCSLKLPQKPEVIPNTPETNNPPPQPELVLTEVEEEKTAVTTDVHEDRKPENPTTEEVYFEETLVRDNTEEESHPDQEIHEPHNEEENLYNFEELDYTRVPIPETNFLLEVISYY